MDKLKEMLVDILFGFLFGLNGEIASATAVLSDDVFNGPVYTSVMGISNILKTFATTIIAICFLISAFKMALKFDDLKIEHIMKVCVLFVISKAALDITPTLLQAIYGTCAKWIGLVSVGTGFDVTTARQQVDAIVQQLDIWGMIGAFFGILLPILATKIVGVMVGVIAWVRKFELLMYVAVSPIPMAFLPLSLGEGGQQSRIPKKFILSFAAVALQGVLILVCCQIYNAITAEVIQNALDAAQTQTPSDAVSTIVFGFFMSSIILITAIMKCGSVAKSVLDVG